MVLAVKGLAKLSWMVIRSFVACADKSTNTTYMYEWNVVQLNIYVSQGSAATEFRCGERFYVTIFRSLSTNPKVKELFKSVLICQSYHKNKSGTFSWPTVNIDW